MSLAVVPVGTKIDCLDAASNLICHFHAEQKTSLLADLKPQNVLFWLIFSQILLKRTLNYWLERPHITVLQYFVNYHIILQVLLINLLFCVVHTVKFISTIEWPNSSHLTDSTMFREE